MQHDVATHSTMRAGQYSSNQIKSFIVKTIKINTKAKNGT